MAEIKKTICYMCTRGCGMDVTVENGRMIKAEGMKEHLVSKGGLCPRGLAAVQYEYDPKRLTHPLKRIGKRGEGKWEKISWDEAIRITSKELLRVKQDYGPQALVFYKGAANGWDSVIRHIYRFMHIFGSPNMAAHSELCYAPMLMAVGAMMGSNPKPDIERSNCHILWGMNPFTSVIANFGRRVLEAKERGAKLIVIDPRFTSAASKADLYVQPRTGTDGALALGVLNVLIEENLYDKDFVAKWVHGFDELAEHVKGYTPAIVEQITRVPQDTIREMSRVYAQNGPTSVSIGNGVDMHTNCVQNSRAIMTIATITGNIDRPGGNVFSVLKGKLTDVTLADEFPFTVPSIDRHPLYFKREGRLVGRDMINALLEDKPYPLKAMIVVDGDPVASMGCSSTVKEGMKKLDFIAVHELYMTAAAEMADIVFPASSQFECAQFNTYASGAASPLKTPIISLRNKVVEPPGECHSDFEFLLSLATEMGFGDEFSWKTEEEAFDEELKTTGITVKMLKEHPEGIAQFIDDKDLYYKYERNKFKTPTGKIEIYSTVFEKFGYDPLPSFEEPGETSISRPDIAKDYPLVCNSGTKPVLYTHNQFRSIPWLTEIMPDAWLEIHPDKARELRIDDGDTVLVESLRGSIKVKAKYSIDIHADTVFIPHGWGQPYARGEMDNLITPDSPLCPSCGATGNRSFLCKVSKI